MQFLTIIRLLLTALWLGAACFFIGVAQTAFGVLRAREVIGANELAGAIVNQSLTIVNMSGLIIGAILLATSFVGTKSLSRIGVWTERLLLFVLTAACAVGQFAIGWWIWYIRSQVESGKTIDELGADNPLRMQFDTAHKYSVWVLMTAMIASLLVFFVISLKSDKTVNVEKKDDFNVGKI